MNDDQPIPFWGPEQLDLFETMSRAVAPEQRISAAMQALAHFENRVLLDVGAGQG